METYLRLNKILFKDYARHVKCVSEQIKNASLRAFREQGLAIEFLRSPKIDKDECARAIAMERKIKEGLVCALGAMELIPTFEHYGTHMVRRIRPCYVVYHYQIDPQWGWMHARIQTWYPFSIHVCLNGREWLGRQMDREGMGYVRQDNCFPWVEDFSKAQQLMNEQLKTAWAEKLNQFGQQLNPIHAEIFAQYPAAYYWSCQQSEWATDVVFQPGELARLESLFVRHGVLNFSSADVMRFLGRKVPLSGQPPANFNGEIVIDWKRRVEGERIKYRLNGNSVKGYGKAHTPWGDVFRPETTLNQVQDFRVYRPTEGGPEDELAWRPMRKGIADLHRRAQVSQAANERFLDALSVLDDSQRVEELIRPLQKPVQWNSRRVRALHPFEPDDNQLLAAVNRGEFHLNGFRNRDLQALLYPSSAADQAERRRRSAAISRKLRLLRAHGLIQKVPKTHRYHVSPKGRLAIVAVLAAQQASLAQLNLKAA